MRYNYTLQLFLLIAILCLFMSCDKIRPDIRKEQINNKNFKPDYFGIRWDTKW